MTLILFAFASGLPLIFAARVHQRRTEIVALTVAESGVRNSPNRSEEFS
tara:strand:- start:1720 stop:1866 length:147 start_codon:yes stop_codon:yes gene_type:complete